MTDPDVRARTQPGRRAGPWSFAVAAACALAFMLTGCRTTRIGEPVAIRIPSNLSEEGAQSLVTKFIDDKLFRSKSIGTETRKIRGNWRIEYWEPGSMIAVYSWRKYLLRVNITFANRTTFLEIGESAELHQSATRIHKRAKRLAIELAQDIRLAYAQIGMYQRPRGSVTSQRTGSKKSSLCHSMWEGDPQEQASCQRAQRRSYDRLRPLISEMKAGSSSLESRRLRACNERTQTWAGETDWEALERCFHNR